MYAIMNARRTSRFKFLTGFCFFIFTLSAKAQFKPSDLFQSWVLTQVQYNDESEVPDQDITKYSYQKYTFTKPNVLNLAFDYDYLGDEMSFELKGNRLAIKSKLGFVTKTMRVEQLTPNAIDQDNLYKRAICYKMLGDLKSACKDWLEIMKLGGANSKVLVQKYCK